MSARECPTVCPITINNKSNVALTQLVEGSSSGAVGTVCLSQLNTNIEILLNDANAVSLLACLENLVNFQDLLNFGENESQAFIVYTGDITVNAQINFTGTNGKDLVIMSTCGSVTINQSLTATNIYVLVPKGTITLGSQANLNAASGSGNMMLSAQNGIVYNQSVITANTLVLSHDIPVGPSVQNKAVNTSGTLLEDVACGSGKNVVTITVEGETFLTGDNSVTVFSGSYITITVNDDVDLELTTDDMIDDLVFNKSITIITPGSVCLPQGLITNNLREAGNGLNISITAGRHIIAQGCGINTLNINGGSVALNAGGSIIVSGGGTNTVDLYTTENIQVSGINSSANNSSSVSVIAGGTIAVSSGDVSTSGSATGINSLGTNSSSVSVIAGDAIIVNSGAVGQSSATGINSWASNNSSSVSVIAGDVITVNSGAVADSSATGINSWGSNSSSDVSVIAGDTITVNSDSGVQTYSATGINSYAGYNDNSSSVSVIAGDTITVNSGAVADSSATGINSWSGGSTSSSGSVSVIALYDITITSGSSTGSQSVSGVNSYGVSSSNSILISACDTISFNNAGTMDSIGITGSDVILIGDIITKDGVTLGTNLSTLTTSTVSRLAQTPCSRGTSCVSAPSIVPVPSALLMCPLPLDALCELLNLLKSLTSNSIVVLHSLDEKIADIHVNDGALYTYSDNQKTPFDVDSCPDAFALGTGICASLITIFESYQQKNDFVNALSSYYNNVDYVTGVVRGLENSMIVVSKTGTGLVVNAVDLPVLQFITLQDRIVVVHSPTQVGFYVYPVSNNVVTLTSINTINTPAPITSITVVDGNIEVVAGGVVYLYDINGNLIPPCSPTKNKRVRKNNTPCNPSPRSRK